MTLSLSARPHPAGFFFAARTRRRSGHLVKALERALRLSPARAPGLAGDVGRWRNIECGRVASKARRGPGAALGAVLRGKIVVELVTEPLTAKVAALVSGGETGPAASIKIDNDPR
jgi:hypothetical protein